MSTLDALKSLRERLYSWQGVVFILVLIALTSVIYFGLRSPKAGQQGLLGKYYRNVNWEGEPADTQIDRTIDFDWSKTGPYPAPYSVEWTGNLLIRDGGNYGFALVSDDGSLLEIDGQLVVDASKVLLQKMSGTINLSPGLHTIRLRYFNVILGGSVRLFWTPPGQSEQIVPGEVLRPSEAAGKR